MPVDTRIARVLDGDMRLAKTLCLLGFVTATILLRSAATSSDDPLLEGFRNPPAQARPATYFLILNGYLNREYVDHELEEYRKAGIAGLCIFDMGARGPAGTTPPAGPAFLSRQSVEDLAHVIRTAGRLGMEVSLATSSSWDLGGSWVEPRDASMTLLTSQLDIEGPREFADKLPFPVVPRAAPKRADGQPEFYTEVATLAVPNPGRAPGFDFVFELPNGDHQEVDRAVLYNTVSEDPAHFGSMQLFAKDFSISLSDVSSDTSAFHEVARGSLEPREGPQEFRFPKTRARFVRLVILNGHNPRFDRVELAEFEVYTPSGDNVLLSHRARRNVDGARLVRFSSEFGQLAEWSADNINDGVKSGARGSWSSAGPAPIFIRDSRAVLNLTKSLDTEGRLHWKAPPGKWTILRYVCTNTGEKLKVPSPNSDGLATDHLNPDATRRCLRYVIDHLKPALGDFGKTALTQLYLPSYEVRGQIWTPGFLDEFKKRRQYDLTPYLPILRGGVVDNENATDRVRYDVDKTLGELLVDAFYGTAAEVTHEAGLKVESEAGGPGPPIHRVPVDALKALGAVDVVRGEFWPYRPNARSLWVIKETASAAHIYGRQRVHMESFTSNYHWQEGPAFLKAAADRAFTEGMNHVVWHTASHQPPEAGKPGWVYGAGTHLSQNRVWWPMAKPFLDYLGRTSFLLQQGTFVGDVLYYYGDQGYNFVLPKSVNPSLGEGFDYDVTNADVLVNRLAVKSGKLVLPEGGSYAVLSLPERNDIDLAVLKRIAQLVAEGATVVGQRPVRSSGFTDRENRDREVRAIAAKLWAGIDGKSVVEHRSGKGKIIWGKTLRDVLRDRGVGPDFTYSAVEKDAGLDYIHRHTETAEIYFIRNKKSRWQEVEARFRVRKRQPELWMPDTGEIMRYPTFSAEEEGTSIPLRLGPDGSLFVVFRDAVQTPAITAISRNDRAFTEVDWQGAVVFREGAYEIRFADGSRKRQAIEGLAAPVELRGPWLVGFEPDRGAPDTAVFPALLSWTERTEPGIRYYSGVGEYRTRFDWGAARSPQQRVFLDLGKLWATAEIVLNGKHLGIAWKEPYRVEVTQALNVGSNQLVIRVANDWANRLIGDARDPSGKHFTKTNIERTTNLGTPWAKVDPIPSGLFGPVVLQSGRTLLQ